ncbi:cytochrome c3 family protein [Desulfocurvus sp. DL9XJH121]
MKGFPRTTFLLLSALALLALAALPLSAADAPKDPITMQVPDGATATKPTVLFPHAKHAALDCTACHHKWDGKSAVVACKSAGCHDDVSTKKGDKAYYLAYHKPGKQSCLGCHKALKTEKAPAFGPVKCAGCHVK